MIPLLSAFYFGSVEHYRLLAAHPTIVIDTGEHYVRQSYRTRTGIVGPNGPQDLSVQVEHDHGDKMPVRDVRLSYAETWPRQHLHAIRSAYGKTPWFIHYIDDIEAVLSAGHERLIDLDLATMRLGMEWLGLGTEVEVREEYVAGPRVGSPGAGSREPWMDVGLPAPDFRTALHPKKPLPSGTTSVPPYPQVFTDRHGFVPRMSVIDLVMNTGPEAMRYLLAEP